MNDQNLVIKEIFALAFQNYKKNNLKNAQKLYNQILNKEPNHFGSIFYLGSISLQNKNFVKAKQLFEKAVKIQPTYANAHHNLAVILFKRGYESKDSIEKRSYLGKASAEAKRSYDLYPKDVYKETWDKVQKAMKE